MVTSIIEKIVFINFDMQFLFREVKLISKSLLEKLYLICIAYHSKLNYELIHKKCLSFIMIKLFSDVHNTFKLHVPRENIVNIL